MGLFRIKLMKLVMRLVGCRKAVELQVCIFLVTSFNLMSNLCSEILKLVPFGTV